MRRAGSGEKALGYERATATGRQCRWNPAQKSPPGGREMLRPVLGSQTEVLTNRIFAGKRWTGVRLIHYVEIRVRTSHSVLGQENAKIGRRRWDEEPKTDEKENVLELPALLVLAIQNEQGLTMSGILNRMKTVSVEGGVRKQRF